MNVELLCGTLTWKLAQEWDAYLARYSRQLPLSSDRAGEFEPLPSLWDRIFKRGTNGVKDDMIFPPDSQLLPTHVPSPKLEKEKEKLFGCTPPPSFKPYPLTRKRTALTKSRSPKFGDQSSSDDDSDDEKHDSSGGPPKFKPWLMKRTSTGHTTLVGEMGALVPPPKLGTTVEEYSDVEQDVTAMKEEEDRTSPGWKPAFLRKHEARKSLSGGKDDAAPQSPIPLSRQTTLGDVLPAMPMPTPIGFVPPAPIGAAPTTPSLIQAYNRINKAQQDARVTSPPTEPRKKPSLELDDGFWNKVRAKAGEPS